MNPVSTSKDLHAGKHLAALDGFRGLAILLVIAYHYLPFAGAGWCGVDLFFVLSGFLITWKLVQSIDNKNYFSNFYLRRVLRIVPLYLVMLVIVFVLIPTAFPGMVTNAYKELIGQQGSYWTFTQNWYDAKHGWPTHIIIIHFWSLATEMQFHLFWPFMVKIFRNRIMAFFVVLLVFIVLANLFRYWG